MGGQPESVLSLKINKAMTKRGAFMWKVHGNEYTPAGIPDLVGAFRGQAIGVETKMPGGKLSVIQEYRIEKMRLSGYLIVAPCFSIPQALELLDLLQEHSDSVAYKKPSGNALSTVERERREVWNRLCRRYGRDAGFPAV